MADECMNNMVTEDWPPTKPGKEDEQTMFELWLHASWKQCQLEQQKEGFQLPHHQEEAKKAEKDCMEAVHDWCMKGWYYDPSFRRFTPFLAELHPLPTESFMLYRPHFSDEWVLEHKNENSEQSLPKTPASSCVIACDHPGRLERTYRLVMTSSESKHNPENTPYMEKFLTRDAGAYNVDSLAYIGVAYNCQNAKLVVKGNSHATIVRFAVDEWTAEGINRIMDKVLESDSEFDLILIDFGDKVKDRECRLVVDSFIPSYPLLFGENKWILSPMQLVQVNGLATQDMVNVGRDIWARCAMTLGAVLLGDDYNTEEPIVQPFEGAQKEHASRVKNSNFFKVCSIGFKSSAPLAHGWLSSDTRATLSAALKLFRPKVVLELGTWFGLSTRLIASGQLEFASSSEKLTLITVDRFQNMTKYSKPILSVKPIEKLFYSHSRLETTHRNLQNHAAKFQQRNHANRIYTLVADCHDAPLLVENAGYLPDLVFIDCEKKTERLLDLIQNIRGKFPHAVIVGDDFVFSSVRTAIGNVSKYEKCVMFEESYVVLPSHASFDTCRTDFQRERLEYFSDHQGPFIGVTRRCQSSKEVYADTELRYQPLLSDPCNIYFSDEEVSTGIHCMGNLSAEPLKTIWNTTARNLSLPTYSGPSDHNHISEFIMYHLFRLSHLEMLWKKTFGLVIPMQWHCWKYLKRWIRDRNVSEILHEAKKKKIDPLHTEIRDCPTGRLVHEICHVNRNTSLDWDILFAESKDWKAPLHNDAGLTPFDLLRFECGFL